MTDLPLPTRVPLAPEEEALLRRCHETPWDDAPILIYADWVQDNGEDARAAAIRASVAAGRLTAKIPPGMAAWAKRVLPAAPPEAEWAVVRGLFVPLVKFDFLDLLTDESDAREPVIPDWMSSDDEVTAAVEPVYRLLDGVASAGWPVAVSVRMAVHMPRVAEALLGAQSAARHVRVLRLEGDVDMDVVRAVAASENLTDLWYLRVAGAPPGSPADRVLRASKTLKNLRVIDGGP